jgi:hypothetical protein
MILEISNKEALKNFKFLFTIILFVIGKCVIDFPENSVSFFVVMASGLTLLFLPAFFLFWQHKRDGKNKRIVIEENSIVEMIDGEISVSVTFEEIDYILYVRGANLDDNIYIPFTIQEKFNFMKIIFKNGKNVTITSCMKSNLKELKSLFDPSKIIWVKTGWCSLKRNYDYEINLGLKSLNKTI